MESKLDSFGKTAQKLARNPLGIIALFIVLVYGIAGLVFSTAGQHLTANQKWPLISFLVFFPVIVLGAFYRLVTNHHTKLYAPADFQDKEGFFRALTPDEQKKKLEDEIKTISKESLPQKNEINIHGPVTTYNKDLMANVVLAEDLAIREIESEYGVHISRNVGVGYDIRFDGVFNYKNNEVVVEVKYARSINWKTITNKVSHQILQLSKQPRLFPVSFLLVIVHEPIDERSIKDAKNKIHAHFSSLPIKVKIKSFDYETLKMKYGIKSDN